MGPSRTTGAGRRTRRRICSTTSTTAVCYASRGAPLAFESMRDGNTSLEPLDPEAIRARIDALIDVVVAIYAPLPRASLSMVVSRLRYAVPQWRAALTGGPRSGTRCGCRRRASTASTGIGRPANVPSGSTRTRRCGCFRRSTRWSGIAGVSNCCGVGRTASRPTRPWSSGKRGYYALPLLWRDRVIGWANVSWRDGALQSDVGYIGRSSSVGSQVQPRAGGGATEHGKISCQHGKTLT